MDDNFTAHVAFEGEYQELYDQAGCMLRLDGENWIKAGVEHPDGVPYVSTVVTRNGRSDWSVMPAPNLAGEHRQAPVSSAVKDYLASSADRTHEEHWRSPLHLIGPSLSHVSERPDLAMRYCEPHAGALSRR